MENAISRHYDTLLRHGDDPVQDSAELQAYMDLWDGAGFIAEMRLTKEKSVLEIGVGTGRLAVRVAPECGAFCGIDIAPDTLARAREYLPHAVLICDDFLTHDFAQQFDVIYSSLTFMHIENKQAAVNKAAALLGESGRFVLSIDKNQATEIDAGCGKITVYPDNPTAMAEHIQKAGLRLEKQYETQHAYVFVSVKG